MWVLDLETTPFFEWDEANSVKNWEKHKVSQSEAEAIFFNEPLYVVSDSKHSQKEARYAAYGQTHEGRLLAAIFTRRKQAIRIISARPMSRKERELYEK